MRRLILNPINGLANRLRALAGGLGLVRDCSDVALDIVWHPCKHYPVEDYQTIFDPLEGPHMDRVRFTDRHALAQACLFPGRLRWRRHLRSDGEGVEAVAALFPDLDVEKAADTAASGGAAYLKTCHKIYDGHWAPVRPVQRIRDRIDAVAEDFGPQTVGVHIRRGDSIRSIEQSPLDLFVREMEAITLADDRASFFLATDSPDVAFALRDRFRDRLLTRSPDLTRDTLAGTEDAVVDLWCLSRTSRVLGSYWSSFSETAADISGIPYRQIALGQVALDT